MFKLMTIFIFFSLTLAACEKQKQAAADVGAVPKQIMNKATNDLSNAQALEAEQRKALENVDAPADAKK